jgi:hypothetical protein
MCAWALHETFDECRHDTQTDQAHDFPSRLAHTSHVNKYVGLFGQTGSPPWHSTMPLQLTLNESP